MPFNKNSQSTSAMPSLPPLDFPKMPTFFEMVESDRHTSEAPKPKGLFETLLGGHVEVLYVDVNESPEKYSDETRHLLTEIVSGQKKVETLTLADRVLLDQAVIDFASAKKKPPPLTKTASVESVAEDDGDDEVEIEETKEASTSEASLVPYWWL